MSASSKPTARARRKPDGSPEIRTILFPVTSATMYDVWDVIGLQGTGTDSYSVENLFIPERFAALRDDPAALREKGPLYQLSTNMVFGMGFAATSLGVARATLDAAIELARGKTPQGTEGDARQQRRAGTDRPHRSAACAPRAPISTRPRPRSGAICRAAMRSPKRTA